jgi:tripartite-type tricarboxylate transporter receptor subunit TctC
MSNDSGELIAPSIADPTSPLIRDPSRLPRRAMLGGGAAIAASSLAARAQTWPMRPITLLAWSGAGSTSVPIVVDNKPGANGTIALDLTLRAPADGYLLVVISQGTHAFNRVIYPTTSYDPVRDFAPVMPLIQVANALMVPADSPYRTAEDIVLAARAKPGTITFASGGNGTSHHISAELLAQMTGTKMVHVPYRTVAQGTTAVIAREVEFAFFNIATAIAPRDAKQVRLIGVTSAQRSALLPDVPTVAETGIAGYEMSTWVGVSYRAGVPEPVLMRMHAALAKAMAEPEMRAALARLGVDPMEPLPPAAFAALIKSEIEKWHPVLRAAGIGAG